MTRANQAQRPTAPNYEPSGGGAFFVDDGTGQNGALAAFGLATEGSVHLAGGDRSGAGGFTNLAFPDGIADADDQDALLSSALELPLMRVDRKPIARHSQIIIG
ncbi:hypothetical protein QCF01_18110, partial [Staphylococcus aureus]|nr:hypothetical protein [Staphylococcus aureus]